MSTEPTDTSDERLAAVQGKLLLFFAARVIDRTVRADLVGRVSVRVLERLRGTAQVDDVERFAFGVARNVLQEYWRERKRRDRRFRRTGHIRVARDDTRVHGRQRALVAGLAIADHDLECACLGAHS